MGAEGTPDWDPPEYRAFGRIRDSLGYASHPAAAEALAALIEDMQVQVSRRERFRRTGRASGNGEEHQMAVGSITQGVFRAGYEAGKAGR